MIVNGMVRQVDQMISESQLVSAKMFPCPNQGHPNCPRVVTMNNKDQTITTVECMRLNPMLVIDPSKPFMHKLQTFSTSQPSNGE